MFLRLIYAVILFTSVDTLSAPLDEQTQQPESQEPRKVPTESNTSTATTEASPMNADASDMLFELQIAQVQCKADGGAQCGDETGGVSLGIAADYQLRDWVRIGVSVRSSHFGGQDDFTSQTAFMNIKFEYRWSQWAILGGGGYGLARNHFERQEPIGNVEYSYLGFSALNFTSQLTYHYNQNLRVFLASTFDLGGSGELCVKRPNGTEACRDEQDLVDLWHNAAGIAFSY